MRMPQRELETAECLRTEKEQNQYFADKWKPLIKGYIIQAFVVGAFAAFLATTHNLIQPHNRIK